MKSNVQENDNYCIKAFLLIYGFGCSTKSDKTKDCMFLLSMKYSDLQPTKILGIKNLICHQD